MLKLLYGGGLVCAPHAVSKVKEIHYFHRNGYHKEHQGGGGGPDEQPNPSGAELGATEQQYMLGETFLTKVRNRMCQELCNVTV